jgi:N-acyl-L-homoserine lactone synthetase
MPANLVDNSEVIPVIETSLFDEHPTSHLAVGIVAIGGDIVPGRENEFKGYSLLRGNVYAKQKNYMPLDDLNGDGTESDPDDLRSIHFALIENAVTSARVVGTMRLIVKQSEADKALPIEDHYEEAFEGCSVPAMSTEVSRLICRHENGKLQNKFKWPLFTAGVTYIAEHGLGPVFGAVETSLEQGLVTSGVPVTQLGEAKFVEEFNSSKLPIRIDIPGLTAKINSDRPNLLASMTSLKTDFVYSGTKRPIPQEVAA